MEDSQSSDNLHIILTVVIFLFLIGLITFLFILFNGEIQDATSTTISYQQNITSVINQTYITNESFKFLNNASQGVATSMVNRDVYSPSISVHRSGLMFNNSSANYFYFPNNFGTGLTINYTASLSLPVDILNWRLNRSVAIDWTTNKSISYLSTWTTGWVIFLGEYGYIGQFNYSGQDHLLMTVDVTEFTSNWIDYVWNGSDFIIQNSMFNNTYISNTSALHSLPQVALWTDFNGVIRVIGGDVNRSEGWRFNGTGWQRDSSSSAGVLSGLAPNITGTQSIKNYKTLIDGNDDYLLVTSTNATANRNITKSFKWNGSYWNEDNKWANGIATQFTTHIYNPIQTNLGNYLIVQSAQADRIFRGYEWNGSSWIRNDQVSKTSFFNTDGQYSFFFNNSNNSFFVNEAGFKAGTYNFHHRALLENFNFLVNNRLLSINPVSGVGAYSVSGTLNNSNLSNKVLNFTASSYMNINSINITGKDELDIPKTNYTISNGKIIAKSSSIYQNFNMLLNYFYESANPSLTQYNISNESFSYVYNAGLGTLTSMFNRGVFFNSINVHLSGLIYNEVASLIYNFPRGFGTGGSVNYNIRLNVTTPNAPSFNYLQQYPVYGNSDTIGEAINPFYQDDCNGGGGFINKQDYFFDPVNPQSVQFDGQTYVYLPLLNTSNIGDASCNMYMSYDTRFFVWNGTALVKEDSLTLEQSNFATYSSYNCVPAVWNDNGILKSIRVDDCNTAGTTFTSHQFNDTAWISNASIKSGLNESLLLASAGRRPRIYSFTQNNNQYLVIGAEASGPYSNRFYGYRWNGASWVSDSAIESNLNNGVTNTTLPLRFAQWFEPSDLKYHAITSYGETFSTSISYLTWNGTSWNIDTALASDFLSSGMTYTPNNQSAYTYVNNSLTNNFFFVFMNGEQSSYTPIWHSWTKQFNNGEVTIQCQNSISWQTIENLTNVSIPAFWSFFGSIPNACLINNNVSLRKQEFNGLQSTITLVNFSGIDEFNIPTADYSLNNGSVIANSNSTYQNHSALLSYVYEAGVLNIQTTTNSQAGQIAQDTSDALSTTINWFPIIIVISAMVVLIFLTVLIINSIRGGGLFNSPSA